MSTVTLTLSLFDFGCLRGLVEREIVNVERHARVVGYRGTAEDGELMVAYLRQLNACLVSIETAAIDERAAA